MSTQPSFIFPGVQHLDPGLALGATLHFLAVLVCVGLLFTASAPPILGVHPALKPLKFALSIGVFLGSLAVLLPLLRLSATTQLCFSWLFVGTMLLEMTPIVLQALRGTTSHFNVGSTLNSRLWLLMMAAIVVATLGMLVLSVIASTRPMGTSPTEPLSALSTWAWRLGLWSFMFAAISGFAMGGRMSHSVGGIDGGSGRPLTNWSTTHGDLRVSHFFALHAIQTLPVAAWLIQRTALGERMQWVLFAVVLAVQTLLTVWTFAQAVRGQPIG